MAIEPPSRSASTACARPEQGTHDLLTDNTRVLRAMLRHPDPGVPQFGIAKVADHGHSPTTDQALKHMIETDADHTVQDIAALPRQARPGGGANAQNEAPSRPEAESVKRPQEQAR